MSANPAPAGAPAQGKSASLDLRRIVIILVTIAIYFIITKSQPPEGLTPEGQKSIALMVGALIFWVLDVFPISITALLFAVLQPIVGAVNPGSMAANYMPTSFFFCLACFLFGQALLDTGLGNRIVLILLRASKNNPRKLLFLLMCVTALISTVIANLALSAMMVPLLVKIFQENKMEPLKSNFAKACLIGVPLAISIGGCATPAGALPNYQAMALTEQVTGHAITFGDWFLWGGPLALVLTPISYFIVLWIFKPEVKELVAIDYDAQLKAMGRISPKEIIFIVVFGVLIYTWFTIPSIPMPVSAIVAVAVLFLPKVNILNGESFNKAVNWHVLMLLCGSTGLAMAIFQTGAAEWIATSVLSPFTNANLLVMIGAIILFTIYMHLLIPPNPSLVAVLVPIIALFAPTMGVPVPVLILPMAYAANMAALLPFDPVFGVTYAKGYYTMRDLPKVGVPMSIAWLIVGVALMAVFTIGIV